MRRLQRTLETFLDEAGALTSPKLGAHRQMRVDADAVARFSDGLKRDQVYNKRLLNLILGAYILCFGFALFLNLYALRNPWLLGTGLGVSFVTLLVITRELRSLWIEKSALDVLLAVVPLLSPAEVVRLAEELYFSAKPGKRAKPKVPN